MIVKQKEFQVAINIDISNNFPYLLKKRKKTEKEVLTCLLR
jgi:hypothetical protein